MKKYRKFFEVITEIPTTLLRILKESFKIFLNKFFNKFLSSVVLPSKSEYLIGNIKHVLKKPEEIVESVETSLEEMLGKYTQE